MADNKSNKMGLGLLVGMLIGAVGGIFLAPKSGKENREAVGKKWNEMKDMVESGEMKEKIEEVFGDLSDQSVELYTQAREKVMKGVEDLKNMSQEEYEAMVQKVMDKIEEGKQYGEGQVAKLKKQFMKEYPEVKEKVERKKRKVEDKADKTKEKLLADKKVN